MEAGFQSPFLQSNKHVLLLILAGATTTVRYGRSSPDLLIAPLHLQATVPDLISDHAEAGLLLTRAKKSIPLYRFWLT